MALYCDVGTLTVPAATGNQDIAFTPAGGVSYTPLFIEFWTVNVASDGLSVGGAGLKFGYGCAIPGGSQRSVYIVGQDNVASGGHHRRHDDTKCITTVTNAGAVFTAASCTSAGTDTFRLNWSTANVSQRVIHYRVWGGSDITNVAIASGVIPASDGVDDTFTGLGFTPTFAKIFSIGHTTAPPATTTGIQFCMGVTDGIAQGFVGLQVISATDANRVFSSGSGGTGVFGFPDSSDNLDSEALFSSFSSGKMTLDWQDVTDTPDVLFGWFMAGPSFYVGSTTTKTTTGEQKITPIQHGGPSGTSFTSKGISLISVGGTTSSGVTTGAARISYGSAVSNSKRASVWTGETDNTSPTVSDTVNESDHVLTVATEGTPTIVFNADLDSFSSGHAVLDVEVADGTAYYFLVEAAGDTIAGGGDSSGTQMPLSFYDPLSPGIGHYGVVGY